MSETTREMVQARQEGRLADPDVELRTDRRLHPGLRAGLAAFGLDGRAAPAPFDRTAAPEAVAEFVGASHAGFEGLYAAVPSDWPDEVRADVEYRQETTTGVDGNQIPLHVFRPAGGAGPPPCTVYPPGGGQTIPDPP